MSQGELPPEMISALETGGLDLSPMAPGQAEQRRVQDETDARYRQQRWLEIRQSLVAVPGSQTVIDILIERYHPDAFIEVIQESDGLDETPLSEWLHGHGDPAAVAAYMVELTQLP